MHGAPRNVEKLIDLSAPRARNSRVDAAGRREAEIGSINASKIPDFANEKASTLHLRSLFGAFNNVEGKLGDNGHVNKSVLFEHACHLNPCEGPSANSIIRETPSRQASCGFVSWFG
jgi:hypothetical protein